MSPTFARKKYQLQLPNLCPEERRRDRLLFRNERNLYKRVCDATGKTVISNFAPDTGYLVYSPGVRWSDSRTAMDF